METILIRHPLREIIYHLKLKEERIYSVAEEQALQNYVYAHNTVWQMKVEFEKEKADAMLYYIDLNRLIGGRKELENIYNFYKPQIDFGNPNLHIDLDMKLQIELRDYCNTVYKHQQNLIKFYDHLGPKQTLYGEIVQKYFTRTAANIDPANFTLLDEILTKHPEDSNVDITSLDKDLKEFLKTTNDVYVLLDEYIEEYNTLYTAYLGELDKTEELVKTITPLNSIWK
ncbi:hypothetical protein ORI89_09360 [Sphingobacterium sp. UT-1RO-CII-1]|uniref:hypothetical protein n=1 Tax=Sphingobacterium sp. UT-1RO-CII-1 TaxID=2995225 RepID=UPI00227D3F6D|nr:hypothetical protein [Sphingobacterium sp. UT-1RO-CII-1]MCY4779859.1 hypothetical protein [Sphingobacterium sp. UT-1RO-CII-1]